MADQVKATPAQLTAELAAIERGDSGKSVVPANIDPTKGRVTFWSSLAPVTPTDKVRLYNAMIGEAKPLEGVIGDVIVVEHVIFQGIDVTDFVTGEIKPAVRVVLISPNGALYGCVSDGIRKSVKELSNVVGMLPWTGGLHVIPRKGKSKKGLGFYYLEGATPEQIDKYNAEEKAKAAKTAARQPK